MVYLVRKGLFGKVFSVQPAYNYKRERREIHFSPESGPAFNPRTMQLEMPLLLVREIFDLGMLHGASSTIISSAEVVKVDAAFIDGYVSNKRDQLENLERELRQQIKE